MCCLENLPLKTPHCSNPNLNMILLSMAITSLSSALVHRGAMLTKCSRRSAPLLDSSLTKSRAACPQDSPNISALAHWEQYTQVLFHAIWTTQKFPGHTSAFHLAFITFPSKYKPFWETALPRTALFYYYSIY